MNQEKMGKFIAELRKEKNLSQYELADLIPISRDAVSKWERGKRCPDPQVLVKLSEIFNVSIDELLYGERKTKSNIESIDGVSLKLYKDTGKKRKTIKLLIITIIFLLIGFLGYYFITTYNSLQVYLVTYEDDNLKLEDGVLVMSNEKLYFNLGEIVTDLPIKSLDLFYKNKDGKEESIINVTDDFTIVFQDLSGQNRFIDFKKIDYIIKNLYLRIDFETSSKTIKLKLYKNFSNDNLLYTEEENIGIEKANDIDYNEVKEKAKEKLNCDEIICTMDHKKYDIMYMFDNNLLLINTKGGNIEFNFNPITKNYSYKEYLNNVTIKDYNYSYNENKLNCEIGDCKNFKEEVKEFLNIANSIFE